MAFYAVKPAATMTSTQEFYSSELFNSSYKVATSPTTPPGVKWAAKKFSSGVRASADNERFLAMREANCDRRPFAGGPFDPSNTVVTTGKAGAFPSPKLASYPSPQPVVPMARDTAPRALTLAQLKASI